MEGNHNNGEDASASRKDHPRAREILQALRHGDFSETQLRVALIILEFGYRRGAAVLNRQNYFAILDGRMDAPKVSTTLKWLLARKVAERVGGVYFFRPPAEWQVKLRAEAGSRMRQLSLEDWIHRQERQLGLKLFELDEELNRQFLDEPVVSKTTPVVSEATPHGHHTNVGTNVEVQRKRSTLNGQEAREAGDRRLDTREERLEILRQFFAARDGEAVATEELSPEGSLGLWRPLVDHAWHDVEVEMGEIKMQEASGHPTTTTAARRLTHLLRTSLGDEGWKRVFPNAL